MHNYTRAGALCAVALAAALGAPPSNASTLAHPAIRSDDPGSFTMRLVDIPMSLVNDTRARQYIIDDLRPGTVIERRIEVANTSDAPARVALYPSAATITKGSFVGELGRKQSELVSWTSLKKNRLVVPARSTARTSVTIKVPEDAAPGERYGVVWAQISGGRGPGVTLVNRTGIRLYLSISGNNPAASDFTVDTMTAGRDTTGHAILKAQVHNTGGRALDFSGTLNLVKVSGTISAGPYPVQLGTTLAPGQSEPVQVLITDNVADGPWNATLKLKSGLLEKSHHARIKFPHSSGIASPAAAQAGTGTGTGSDTDNMAMVGVLAGLLVGAAVPAAVLLRRRKTTGQDP